MTLTFGVDDAALFLYDELVGPHRLALAVHGTANDLEVRFFLNESEVRLNSVGLRVHFVKKLELK